MESFSKKNKGLQPYCKDCNNKYHKQHYINNKKIYLNKSYAYRKQKATEFRRFKSTQSCKYCGENFWACLDFHHRNRKTKKFKINDICRGEVSDKILKKELEKCDVVCANCHRKLHNNGL